MAETSRPGPANLTPASPSTSTPKEAAMLSGRFKELPPIPQEASPGLEEMSPAGSDQFDFATIAASPRLANPRDNEPSDYLNGGLPHDDPSPLVANTASARPPPLNLEKPSTAGPPRPGTIAEDPSQAPSSPAGRRSVQFARGDTLVDPPAIHSRHGSWDTRETLGKIRGSSFMSKLKEFAGPSAVQGSKPSSLAPASELGSTASSPAMIRPSAKPPRTLDEGSEEDADAEETADEGLADEPAKSKKKRRRFRRPKQETLSTPNTPRLQDIAPGRIPFGRRATMPSAVDRGGLSEGEGRDHLAREVGALRGSSWISTRGHEAEDVDSPTGLRLGHLRRKSAFGGGVSDGDAITPRRPFFGAERASTFGHKVKSTLKLLRQKKEERFDYYKSAELMAELRAGAPAVLMLASMIQRDEHGNKRIPVLLEQLRVHISDSAPVQDGDSERHWLFTIDMEYGNGPSRMKWVIKRTIRDILNLHWKYKLALNNEKYLTTRLDLGARPKQPKFPLSAFPYLRGARGLGDDDEEDPAEGQGPDEAPGEGTAGEGTAAEGTATDVDGRPRTRKRKSRMNVLGGRRKGSALNNPNGSMADISLDPALARRRYVERQQKMLEKYLQEMIHWLMFRADSNRLCRFLELSALGVRLAAEGSYHGKECYLHIQSSKGLDFRRVLTPGKVIARHSRKWFLVRQSYIVCVESPENMNIYDVYLVDPKFKIISKKSKRKQITAKDSTLDEEMDFSADMPARKHHTLKILTSERKVKLFSRNQNIIQQFEDSITEMLKQTPWHIRNRFGSFAPVRTGVNAQWLVDGRDYMWNVSRAINMARDVIYIHDWWLSPELYMRRPACISQKWRLDRLLQRKAKEGVKIFVIVYRNVEAAIPIDSEYTKFSLLNLHPNIFVQRSPNQFKKNQFFFAHHEKICVVDHDVAFLGGIDLCFGRWDCPEHPVADDKATGFETEDVPKDAEHCQLFPGKDYSNPRVQDFFRLNEPYEEMYDRSRVPRMPWHDVSMQVVGQPARDLTRHFVQRWNYLRRGRKPTRPTPFLLPPPDYKKEDLEALGLTGTCEVQILRSASTWSLGIEDTEASIQSAYIRMIEDSDHFVYIENQFFISSTETMNTKLLNRIGDALVHRIIKAHEKDEDWRAVILMPLMPGFQNEVNEQDGTSVRLILQCQYRSICRGDHSIFGRLRAEGIDPEDYIQFFSLRQWGKLGHDRLTTEQLYIHAKCIIVDDRIALIGSANINERSMLGNRDSECAAIVRDTDMLWSTMAGRPYKVGRFAHTLRLRLMREHLGLDVDEILEEERQADLDREAEFETEMDGIYADGDSDVDHVAKGSPTRSSRRTDGPEQGAAPPLPLLRSSTINHDVDLEGIYSEEDAGAKGKEVAPGDKRVTGNPLHQKEVEGLGKDRWKHAQETGFDRGRDSIIVQGREVLLHGISPEGKGTIDHPKTAHHTYQPPDTLSEEGGGNDRYPPVPAFDRRTTEQLGLPRANQLPSLPALDDTDIGGPPLHVDAQGRPCQEPAHAPVLDIRLADIHKDCMRDPLNPAFFEDIWCRVAENNTKIFRRVFRCMPDSEATNWADYKEYKAYAQRFKESMDGHHSSEEDDRKSEAGLPPRQSTAAAGIGAPGVEAVAKALGEKATGAVPGPSIPSGLPKIISHHGEEAMDEKTSAADDHEPDGLATDPEKANGLPARSDHDGGITPFPAIEEDVRPVTETNNKLELKPDGRRERRTTFSSLDKPPNSAGGVSANGAQFTGPEEGDHHAMKPAGSQRRRRRTTTRGSRRGANPPVEDLLGRAEAEELLNMTQGALVQFPYDWLVTEETNGNWLFQVDQVAPLQI
ncbi:phospholipase D [Thozetella sp. PMI_491]|nr:phospholipase D [Thozetella sp. PMI_491]